MKLYWTYDESLGWCERSRIYLSERQAKWVADIDGLRVAELSVPEKFAHAEQAYGIVEVHVTGTSFPRLLWLTREEALDALGIDWPMVEEFEIL